MEKDYIYSNAKLHYTIISGNSDTPLVLLHGQCMCGQDYEKVIEGEPYDRQQHCF